MITICVCNVARSASHEWEIREALEKRGIETQPGSHWVNDFGGIQNDRPCPAAAEEWGEEISKIVNEVVGSISVAR